MSDDDRVKERLIANDIATKLIELEARLVKLEKDHKAKIQPAIKYSGTAKSEF